MLWFLTGPVDSGKSRWTRCLVDVIKNTLNFRVGGIINNALFEKNEKVGYLCESLISGETCLFARFRDQKKHENDIVCGKWVIFEVGLSFAQRSLQRALHEEVQLIVVDEFGILENQGRGLRSQIDALITANQNVLVIVRDSLLEFVKEIYDSYPYTVLYIGDLGCDKEALKGSVVFQWFLDKDHV